VYQAETFQFTRKQFTHLVIFIRNKVSINRNGLLYKKITDTIDFNKQDINIFINDKWRKYMGGDIENSSKLQGDLNFTFDQ
jgi:hypothetical protein